MRGKPQLSRVLLSLGDETTLKIFQEAQAGFESGDKKLAKLGLTQRQYYRRLSNLLSLGLLGRTGVRYEHTNFGKVINKVLIQISGEALENYWNLQALDEIERSKVIPSQEKEQIGAHLLRETQIKKLVS